MLALPHVVGTCRERMTTLMFEDFNVPAMYVAIQVCAASGSLCVWGCLPMRVAF